MSSDSFALYVLFKNKFKFGSVLAALDARIAQDWWIQTRFRIIRIRQLDWEKLIICFEMV